MCTPRRKLSVFRDTGQKQFEGDGHIPGRWISPRRLQRITNRENTFQGENGTKIRKPKG